MAEAREGIGGNRPPVEAEIELLLERLKRDNAALWARAEELLASFAKAPATIDSDGVAGQVAALRKMLRECGVAIEDQRKAEKGHFDALGNAVQQHFQGPLGRLKDAMLALASRDTAWLAAKAETERQRRAAELKAAEEKAAAERREAEELRRQQQALAELAAKTTDADDMAAIEEQQAAAEAEAQRQRDAQLLAEAEAAARRRDVAQPLPARSTSTTGATSSLRWSWNFRILDRDEVDMEKLRPYLATGAIEKAIREAIRKGKVPGDDGAQPIAGVEIFKEPKSTVR